MKSLVYLLLVQAVFFCSFDSSNQNFKITHSQTVRAGVVFAFIPFFIPEYRRWVYSSCAKHVYTGELSLIECVFSVLLGEQGERTLDSWISPDHPLVTEGIKSAAGDLIRYDEQTRRAHNDLADVFVDFDESYRSYVEEHGFKGSLNSRAIAETLETAALKILERPQFIEAFGSPHQQKAVGNYLQIQYGFHLRPR